RDFHVTGVQTCALPISTENFTINGSVYYGDAKYDSGTFHLNYARIPAVCDNVVCPMDGEISGNRTPRAPRVMATLGAEWGRWLEIGRASCRERAESAGG